MKKQLLIALAISALSATAAFAGATPGTGITDSPHDMNTLGAYNVQPDGQGRVCAFCHTPHHAMTGDSGSNYLPLWSHQLSDNTVFTPYQSGTLDAYKSGTPDLLVGPTRLCMSCHDGSIAVDQHYGSTAATTNRKFQGNDFTGSEPQIAVGLGGSFAGTHPIGFKLADAVAADAAGNNSTGATGFNPGVADGSKQYLGNPVGKTIASQLFQGYMTCATCHDVHNKDNATNGITVGVHVDTANRNYFVFSPQAGSQLCLTCHNK